MREPSFCSALQKWIVLLQHDCCAALMSRMCGYTSHTSLFITSAGGSEHPCDGVLQSKGRITVALYDDVPVGSARFADLARGIQGVGFRRTKFDSVNQARQYHGARAEISLISCPKCNLHCTGPPVPIQARFTRIGHHQRSAWPFSLIHRGLNVVNRQYGCISQHDQAASSQVCSPVCCCASCK